VPPRGRELLNLSRADVDRSRKPRNKRREKEPQRSSEIAGRVAKSWGGETGVEKWVGGGGSGENP